MAKLKKQKTEAEKRARLKKERTEAPPRWTSGRDEAEVKVRSRQEEHGQEEYELALLRTREKLGQLQKQKAILLAKLEQDKITQENQIEEYLIQGERYYQEGNNTSAIKEWSKVLALDFTNTKAHAYIKKAEEALRNQ